MKNDLFISHTASQTERKDKRKKRRESKDALKGQDDSIKLVGLACLETWKQLDPLHQAYCSRQCEMMKILVRHAVANRLVKDTFQVYEDECANLDHFRGHEGTPSGDLNYRVALECKDFDDEQDDESDHVDGMSHVNYVGYQMDTRECLAHLDYFVLLRCCHYSHLDMDSIVLPLFSPLCLPIFFSGELVS